MKIHFTLFLLKKFEKSNKKFLETLIITTFETIAKKLIQYNH